MANLPHNTFSKAERLCSRRLTEELFAGGRPSLSAYPIRVVYMPLTPAADAAKVQVLISVSKRKFKHAVDRNRVKRQIREAYRLQRDVLLDALNAEDAPVQGLAIAFLWLSNEHVSSEVVHAKVKNLLQRISENLPTTL